ncbi:copper resistance protein CopC [Planotetraspora sp. GP83]|uniref:copper resistance CopC family protein n=1 Tax=Planotetraspora sp. GP83 TaxID=3156264 RepID=UPI003511743F
MKFLSLRALFLLCLSCALLTVSTAPALAHDSLKSSSPANNAVVSGVDQIELEFSAHVSYPVVILHDAAGRRFESGAPRTDGPKVLESVAGPLPSGSYVIAWRVVSSDGHPVEGEIPFTVRSSADPSAGVAAPATSAASANPATPASTADQTSGVPGWVWAGLALLVIIGAVALLGGRKKDERPGTDPIT